LAGGDRTVTRRKSRFARFRQVFHWAVRIFLLLLVLDLIYLSVVWPNWKTLGRGPIPKSSFMHAYEAKKEHRGWPNLDWQPVPLSRIPRHMLRAAIVAEDSRFYSHSGFDLIAIREALDYNLVRGELVVGASTISQQTVKNLYLSPSRDPLRKWHELVLTFGLENNVKKSRILELYLNVAEFGRGIYGVQAAARAYYGIDIDNINLAQAAELAATFPSPIKQNPETRTERFVKRSQRILELLVREQSAATSPVVAAP